MKGRRWLQPLILLIGMVGLALAVARSVDDAQEQVLPSIEAIVGASVLAMIAIVASARTWAALFNDVLDTKANRVALNGTFYLSQLTKYLPGGGVVQAASQLSLAPSSGVPLRRVALAFPVSAVCAVVAGATLGSGLVFDGSLPDWTRALVLLGLLTPIFLHRKLMAGVLGVARRVIKRIPHPDHLPEQRDILRSYGVGRAHDRVPGRGVRGPLGFTRRRPQPGDDPLRLRAELGDRLPRHSHPGRSRHS